MIDQIWLLKSAGRVVAELQVSDSDFPWLHARVVARQGFDELRALFSEELRLLDGAGDPDQRWEDAYQRIRAATELVDPDGESVPEFLLHIDGDQAWWRWSVERFDEAGS